MPGGFEDTITSASSYYNNQFRNDPGYVHGYAKIHKSEPKDTIETKQQRLERHLEAQLHLNQQVSGGKIVLFAQVGKYAILALVMPPVYLFYEGPRWILITIQPFIEIAFEKTGVFLLIISTFAIDFWAGLGKKLQFFKKPKDLIKEKIKVVTQAIVNKMAVLGQKLYKIFQPLNQVVTKWKSFVPAFREKRTEFVHFMKILPRLLQKKIEEKKEGFKTGVKEKAANVIAVLAQVQIPFIAVKKVLEPVIKILQNQMAKIINPAVKTVFKSAKLVFTTSKNAVRRLIVHSKMVVNTIAGAIAVPFTLVLKVAEAPIKKAVIHIASVLKRTLNSQKELLLKLAKVTTDAAVIPMQKGFTQINTIALQAGLNLIQKINVVLVRLKKLQPIAKRLIKTIWEEGKKYSKKGFAKFKKLALSSTRVIANAISFCLEKLKMIPSKLYAFFKKIKKWIVKFANRTVWALRVALAWTKVILRYSVAHLWD